MVFHGELVLAPRSCSEGIDDPNGPAGFPTDGHFLRYRDQIGPGSVVNRRVCVHQEAEHLIPNGVIRGLGT
jgi:hypothetical protein